MFQKLCERECQMKTEIELIVEDGIAGEPVGAIKSATPRTDDDVMDAYSRAVITAAEKVSRPDATSTGLVCLATFAPAGT